MLSASAQRPVAEPVEASGVKKITGRFLLDRDLASLFTVHASLKISVEIRTRAAYT